MATRIMTQITEKVDQRPWEFTATATLAEGELLVAAVKHYGDDILAQVFEAEKPLLATDEHRSGSELVTMLLEGKELIFKADNIESVDAALRNIADAAEKTVQRYFKIQEMLRKKYYLVRTDPRK